jgi:hypothetical protein
MEAQLITLPLRTLRCDDSQLGTHRYWQMRFCAPACLTGYQKRLSLDILGHDRFESSREGGDFRAQLSLST